MKNFRIQKVIAVYIFILFGLSATNAAAESPTAQIKSTVDRVITLLTDPSLQGNAKNDERHELLRQTIFARFDFQEMAKRSLGSHWRRRTVEEQNQFVAVFRDLLEKAYLDRIESYNKEKFTYTNEKIDEPYAEVGGKILTAEGEEFSIRYRLLRVSDQWKIYDVVIEDVSLVNNYRAQFNRILANSSYEQLVQRIKRKLTEKTDR